MASDPSPLRSLDVSRRLAALVEQWTALSEAMNREATAQHGHDSGRALYCDGQAMIARLCAAELSALASALEASTPSQGWQPIEHAPKDGTSLLGYQQGWCINGGEINITNWSKDWKVWQISSADWRPTHWMPLPSAPVVLGAGPHQEKP